MVWLSGTVNINKSPAHAPSRTRGHRGRTAGWTYRVDFSCYTARYETMVERSKAIDRGEKNEEGIGPGVDKSGNGVGVLAVASPCTNGVGMCVVDCWTGNGCALLSVLVGFTIGYWW
jgi:hypothetical protein